LTALSRGWERSNHTGYALLLVPALTALAALTASRIAFPVPSRLEESGPQVARAREFTSAYWLYMLAAACFGAGLMSFELVSFHLATSGKVSEQWVPLFLAFSTGIGIIASLVLGRLYDHIGLGAVLIGVALSSLFSPLLFLGGSYTALLGIVLWGIGYSTQDTLLKALVASMLPTGRRNLAFGLFYTGYGAGWLLGSLTVGLLYSHSLLGVVAFSVGVQLVSLPLFVFAQRSKR